jgi:hypothetical protein
LLLARGGLKKVMVDEVGKKTLILQPSHRRVAAVKTANSIIYTGRQLRLIAGDFPCPDHEPALFR